MISFKGRHYKKTIILMAVRWYVAYSLSYRDIEEMMLERGVLVDHSTLNRWVIRYAPQLELEFRKKQKKKAGTSWRMDETYILVKGKWCYLYRAADKVGDTIDFLLSTKRDKISAKAFFDKAIESCGIPEKVVIDKSGSNFSALKEVDNLQAKNEKIEIHQIKYLNNIIEQDHRFIKKLTRPTKGFKSFKSAHATIKGIELHHMLRKRQFRNAGSMAVFQQFYNLAA